jgi:predicted Zn-dependent protease
MDVFGRLLRFVAAPLLALAVPLAASAQEGCPGPCIRDAEIETILREYSNPIFAAAGLKPDDVNIYLLNDPSMNAMSFGGQNMAINTGLIAESQTPEMLKGVIGHETGHIALGHNVSRREAIAAGGNVSLISMGLGVLAIAAGAPDAGMALIGSAPQFGLLTAFKFTRVEESAADQAGMTYMEKTGQSANGLVAFMEKFRYQELMSEARREQYFRVHPVSTDRVGVMRARAAEITAKAKPQSEKDIADLAIMKAKLVGFLQPAARVYSKYPKTDTSVPARYARAIAAYRAVDIKAALTETQSLIDEFPDNPYYHELYGQILFENGKIQDSIPHHRKSVELAPHQALLKVNLARSLLEAGGEENLKEAEGLLVDAIAQEKGNAFAWNTLAKCYGKMNRVGDADLATAEEAYSIGDTQRAFIFAKRASTKLDPSTPNGRRASDISAIADPRVTGAGRRG